MTQFNSATIREAWHDATCPAGPECSDRSLHALYLDYMVGPLERFVEALPGGSMHRRAEGFTVKGYVVVDRETGEADWDGEVHPTLRAARLSFSEQPEAVAQYDVYALSDPVRADLIVWKP